MWFNSKSQRKFIPFLGHKGSRLNFTSGERDGENSVHNWSRTLKRTPQTCTSTLGFHVPSSCDSLWRCTLWMFSHSQRLCTAVSLLGGWFFCARANSIFWWSFFHTQHTWLCPLLHVETRLRSLALATLPIWLPCAWTFSSVEQLGAPSHLALAALDGTFSCAFPDLRKADWFHTHCKTQFSLTQRSALCPDQYFQLRPGYW